MIDSDDFKYMQHALQLAEQAAANQEVPVGACLVLDNQIIAECSNQTIMDCDPTGHAEINCLRLGAKQLANYRLLGTTLYVTLEPCAMCAAALIHARVARVVYGAADPKAGAAGSVFDILGTNKLNHIVDVTGGVLAAECGQILKDFFAARRK